MNLALPVIATLFGAAAANNPPTIRIAYFVPIDRQPIDGYVELLHRIAARVLRAKTASSAFLGV